MPSDTTPNRTNVADRLAHVAARMPEGVAVVDETLGGRPRVRGGPSSQALRCTFAELDHDATAIARGLVDMGVDKGTRLALLVPPGVAFVKLVFGLLRSGATTLLIDPGMGRSSLIQCLAAARPEGFLAISPAQAVRTLLRHRFRQVRHNVTLGRRWFWGGWTYRKLLERGGWSHAGLPETGPDDRAAIIYTSGSTGPPKGVLYTHRMFDTQACQIQGEYAIEPGRVDLSCFALFGLFNSAMGVTTVFPEMDFSRPASADPRKLLAATRRWKVTQAFASPAVWDKLSSYCDASGERIPTLRNIFSCGAPVPAEVLRRVLDCVHPEAQMHTPYGATESLPVATIAASEVLSETADKTAQGAGVCVGRPFDSIEWRVIRITDQPIATIDQAQLLPIGQIGELIVSGAQVSPEYVAETPSLHCKAQVAEASGPMVSASSNAFAKILPTASAPSESESGNSSPAACSPFWHRMGDVGYFDELGRFWYCGRKSHRVVTDTGTLFTIPCEAIFNQHPQVGRTALVGIGPPGGQTPVLIVEVGDAAAVGLRGLPGRRVRQAAAWDRLVGQLRALAGQNEKTSGIDRFLPYKLLPVDVRHNAKINREWLARWAARQLVDE